MARYKSTDSKGMCIFCKIASGEIKPMGDARFWENDKYIAWLSPFPNTEGFTVLIPKKHYGSDVLVLPDDILKDFIVEAKKVSKILLKYFEDVGRVGLIMEGTGIDHAHIKLIPMHGTEHMKKGIWKQYLGSKSDYYEKYDGYLASNDGPKTDLEKLSVLAKHLKKIKA